MDSETTQALQDFHVLLNQHKDQFRRFKETSFLNTIAEDNKWWLDETARSTCFKPLDSSQETTPENIADHYQKLHTQIGEGIRKAEEEGKKFFLMLGEHHYDRNSLLSTHVAISAAAAHGIELFVDEHSERTQESMESIRAALYRIHRKLPESYDSGDRHILSNNEHFWNHNPEKINMKAQIPGDINRESSFQYVQYSPEYTNHREDGIYEVISQLKGHAMGVFGANHLEGLIERMENDSPVKVSYLALDVSHSIPLRNPTYQASYNTLCDERKHFNLNNPRVEFLTVPGAGVRTAEQARELAEAGIALAAPDRMQKGDFAKAIEAERASYAAAETKSR